MPALLSEEQHAGLHSSNKRSHTHGYGSRQNWRYMGPGYNGSLEIFKSDRRLHILALGTPKFREMQGEASSHGLPSAIGDALASKDGQSIQKAVFEVLAERLSHLILVPLEKISRQLRLSEIGMDSMLAAEYRTFIFRSLSVDVLSDGRSHYK